MNCFDGVAASCQGMADAVEQMKARMGQFVGEMCGQDGTGEGKCSAPAIMACMTDNGIKMGEGELYLPFDACPTVYPKVMMCLTSIQTACPDNTMVQQMTEQVSATATKCESDWMQESEPNGSTNASSDVQDTDGNNTGIAARASVALLSLLSLAAMAWV